MPRTRSDRVTIGQLLFLEDDPPLFGSHSTRRIAGMYLRQLPEFGLSQPGYFVVLHCRRLCQHILASLCCLEEPRQWLRERAEHPRSPYEDNYGRNPASDAVSVGIHFFSTITSCHGTLNSIS